MVHGGCPDKGEKEVSHVAMPATGTRAEDGQPAEPPGSAQSHTAASLRGPGMVYPGWRSVDGPGSDGTSQRGTGMKGPSALPPLRRGVMLNDRRVVETEALQ
jgi:hypothetical protein